MAGSRAAAAVAAAEDLRRAFAAEGLCRASAAEDLRHICAAARDAALARALAEDEATSDLARGPVSALVGADTRDNIKDTLALAANQLRAAGAGTGTDRPVSSTTAPVSVIALAVVSLPPTLPTSLPFSSQISLARRKRGSIFPL